MTFKPISDVPKWCTTDDPFDDLGQPWHNQPRKVAPGSTVVQGYYPATKPPVTEYNWHHNSIGRWFDYFENVSMRSWQPAAFRPTSGGAETSGKVLALGFNATNNAVMYSLNDNRNVWVFAGSNLGDPRRETYGLGENAPVLLMANNDSVTLWVAHILLGGPSSILQYDGSPVSPVSLRSTIPIGGVDFYYFDKGDFIYEPVNDVWVLVGNDGTLVRAAIFTSNDDGTTMTLRTTAISANYVDGLHAVAASTSGDIVAIEGHSTGTDAFKSVNGGVDWTLYNNIGPMYGSKIRFDAVRNQFVIVTENIDRQCYVSNNGVVWSAVTPWWGTPGVSTYGNHQIVDFRIFGMSWVLVTRNLSAPVNAPSMFLTTDGGNTWTYLGTVPVIGTGLTERQPTAFANLNGMGLVASGDLTSLVHFTKSFTA